MPTGREQGSLIGRLQAWAFSLSDARAQREGREVAGRLTTSAGGRGRRGERVWPVKVIFLVYREVSLELADTVYCQATKGGKGFKTGNGLAYVWVIRVRSKAAPISQEEGD